MTDAPRGASPATADPLTADAPLPTPREAAPPAAPTRERPERAPRRSPTELTLPFTNGTQAALVSTVLGEPEWLTKDRASGLAAWRRLPVESNELYTTYVDLRNVDLSGVQLALPGITGRRAADAPAPTLPEGAAAVIEVDEAGLRGLTLGDEARRAGLVLESLTDFLRRDPDAFRAAILREGALVEDDRLAQLTRTFWNAGVHIAVPAGKRLTAPVVVRWSVGAGVALLTRTLLDLADDTELKVIEELVPPAAADEGAAYFAGETRGQALFTGSTEARLGGGASLTFASLQELPETHIAFQHRTAAVGANAHIHWALAQTGSRLVRSRVDNRLEGNGSSVEQVEIVFGSSDQLFDLTSYTRHVGRDATSNLLSKAALQDSARTFLKGLVTIEKSGSGTDSFLGEYGMNLSKKARAVAIPSLEIDQPDCRRVAHSSSVGPIDETQLFYLESRGIPPDEARKFIVLGFLEPVVARVPLESARDRLRELLEAKWDAAHQPTDSASAA